MTTADRKIFIGIPLYGDAPAGFIQSLAALVASKSLQAKVVIKQGDSLVTRARNVITADFLASDCSHLLMIDSDLVFTPTDVAFITGHEAEVVAGFYPLKREGQIQWCGNGVIGEAAERVPTGDLQAVRYMGTGFMCIARRVFERMIEADGEAIRYQSDQPPYRTEHDFWRVGVRPTADARRRYLSEDWYFCQRWLELGGQVFADRRVVLGHIGVVTYPTLDQRLAMQAAAPQVLYPEGAGR